MKKLFLILLFSVISAQVHSDILSEDLMRVCEVIGYESKTEEFAGCVLALRDNAKLNKIAKLKQQHRKAAEAKFAAMHERLQRQYEQQLDEHQAKIKKRNDIAVSQAALRSFLNLAGSSDPNFVSAVSDSATAGIDDTVEEMRRMRPFPKPAKSNFRNLMNQNLQINLPDGSFFSCTYNPAFKTTNCN